VLFFKQVYDLMKEKWSWVQYHHLKTRGQVNYSSGGLSFEIVSMDHIYMYKLDEKTLLPCLQNVMKNYNSFTNIMLTEKIALCYTYNSTSYDVFTRKYLHDFSH
jgi:hypothetical protein